MREERVHYYRGDGYPPLCNVHLRWKGSSFTKTRLRYLVTCKRCSTILANSPSFKKPRQKETGKLMWRFGAMVPKFREQMRQAGLRPFPNDRITLDGIQRDADAAIRLRLRQMLSRSEYQQAIRRIAKTLDEIFVKKNSRKSEKRG